MTRAPMDGLFDGLFDDAALFPPGNAPMERAVPAHVDYRAAPLARYVGPFICPSDRLGELAAQRPPDLEVSVTTADPAEAVLSYPGVRLASVELRPGGSLRELPDGVIGYGELARDADPAAWVASLAAAGWRAKFRTGGTVAGAFPGEEELARWLVAAISAGVPFKCTAGLHHAVRHRDEQTGFEHHGFLNVLAATGVARSGAPLSEVVAALADRDVAERVPEIDPSVRESFRSFGTCSVDDPIADLVQLGLIPA